MIASAFGVLFDGFAYGMLLFLLSVTLPDLRKSEMDANS
jgi:hypothetical protein